ncbi:uncharacterized protein LOC144877418 [Branchiostoma floridae x Branchiostoma japonicum]
MASPLEPGSSLSTISPSGTPQVTPSVSRQSSRLTESGEESASRRPSKVMFTSTPKSERSWAASSEQLRRDSSGSVLSDISQLRCNSSTISDRDQLHRDSGVLSDRRDSSNLSTQSDQLRRHNSVLSDRRNSSNLSTQIDQLRSDSSNLSTKSDQLRRDSGVPSDQLRWDNTISEQLQRDSSVFSDRRDSSNISTQSEQQQRRNSSNLSTQSDQLRRDSSNLSSQSDQLRRDSNELSGQLRQESSMLAQLRRDSSTLSDRDQLRRDSTVLSGQLHWDSSMLAQLRRDSSTLSDRYPSTLCTNDLEAWDSLPRGYLTSSSSGLLSPQKSQEKGDVLTRESTPASSRMFAGSAERSRDTFARDFPSMPSLQSQSSHQSHDSTAPLARVSSGPSELTSQEKSSDMDTSLSNRTSSGSTTKLFSAPSQESAASGPERVQEPSVGTTPVVSPRRSYESSAEALGSSRSTSKTSARESSSLLGGVRHKATAMTRGSGPSGAGSSSGSPDDSEILRRLTNMNERMCNENDLLRKQLKLFRRNAELKQISLISLVIAWHQGLISADECESLSELSQLCPEDGSGGASVVSGRRLSRCLQELASLRPPQDAATRRREREASGPDSVSQESLGRSPREAGTRRRGREASDPDAVSQQSSVRSLRDAVTRRREREASDPDAVSLESSVRSARETSTRRRARKETLPDPVLEDISVRLSRDSVTRRRARDASGPDPVWLESSVREIKRVLHHLERTLIDLDSTVRDHQYLWRDVRRRGTLSLPAPGPEEGVSAPRLYIPRPRAEQQGTADLGEGVSAPRLYTPRPHAEHAGTAVQELF